MPGKSPTVIADIEVFLASEHSFQFGKVEQRSEPQISTGDRATLGAADGTDAVVDLADHEACDVGAVDLGWRIRRRIAAAGVAGVIVERRVVGFLQIEVAVVYPLIHDADHDAGSIVLIPGIDKSEAPA